MRLPAITFSVDIAAPVEVVFDYFADPRNRPAWQSSLKDVTEVDPGEPREGMRWLDVTKVGVRADMRTTVQHRPTRWAETGSWRGVRADLEMRFSSLPGGRTRADVRAELFGSGVYVLAAVGALPVMPLALRADVRTAGRILAESHGQT